jgi:hypothetical protein
MKVIIYSVNIGSYDDFYNPKQIKDYSYIYYTDTHYTGSKWEFIKVDSVGCTKRVSTIYKLGSHLLPEHDISIYMDANMRITGDLTELVQMAMSSRKEIFLFKHPNRNCIYKEVQACIKLKKDEVTPLINHGDKYRRAGYPFDNGLYCSGFIIRKNTVNVRYFNNFWHSEYKKGCKRDQISLPYALAKCGLKPGIIDGNIYNNEYFNFVRHSL